MSDKNLINKDLKEVNNLLRKNIIKEKTISNLYAYIFKKNGKQLRARLSLKLPQQIGGKERKDLS